MLIYSVAGCGRAEMYNPNGKRACALVIEVVDGVWIRSVIEIQ